MRIDSATSSYELWLGARLKLRLDDIETKHEMMASAAFPFFRATFYRWAQLWKEQCSGLDAAPALLAVGDLHVENFGTWRDAEGRLIWGVNDFDESNIMPYTLDLVRLATSALLAMQENSLATDPERACRAILTGYNDCLEAGGLPVVLAEHHGWLRGLAFSALREPCRFWEKMSALPDADSKPPDAIQAIERLMPEPGMSYRLASRVAGLGSLGRIRVVGIADWRGGKIAREAKALAPSAYLWAVGQPDNGVARYADILVSSIRCRDPLVKADDRWICRRLAPDCARVELAALPHERDECKLLRNMGWETGNVHLGSSASIPAVRSHLATLRADWLSHAAQKMKDATMADWQAWRRVMS